MTEEEYYYYNYVIDMVEESALQLESQGLYNEDDDLPW